MTRSGKAIIAAAALVLTVGACGSSSTKSTDTAKSSSDSSGSGSSDSNSLSDLVGKAKTADVKVTYKTGGNDTNTFTLIQRGKDTVYMTGDNAIYTIDGTTTSCQGTGSDATCTQLPSTGSSSGALGTSLFSVYSKLIDVAAKSPLFKNLKTSTATIAGRDAKCVTLTGALAAAGNSGTICVDAETGLLLQVKSDSGDGIVATDVGKPSESDFKLPATPQTIPSFTVPSAP